MKFEEAKKTFDFIFDELGKVIIGQKEPLREVVVALLSNSHAMLESYPGLAKTLAINTLSKLMDLKFSRIQFTPDLMPSDITGTYLIEETTGGKRTFKFQPGPVFTNILLADEINRATPKTQSALLEAMQEKQVTVGTATFQLEEPFFVLATQNPIEQEGTYPLPEAQSDRFLLKIKLDYPSAEEELEIINKYAESTKEHKIKPVLNKDSIQYLQHLARQVPIAADLKKYIVEIIEKTRTKKDMIEYGASPRASIGLTIASKARALLEGRKFVSKNDINKMAFPILRHRIILSFEAERQGLDEDAVIKTLLK